MEPCLNGRPYTENGYCLTDLSVSVGVEARERTYTSYTTSQNIQE